MPEKEIARRYPKLAKVWFYGDVTSVQIPGGESYKHMQQRSWQEFVKLAKKHHGKKILIVTHHATAGAIICKIFGTLRIYNSLSLFNASLSSIILKDKKFKVRYLNDISHLRDLR